MNQLELSFDQPAKPAKGEVRRADGWWVVGLPCGDMGPYDTRQEAEADRRGVERFYKEEAGK